jgi:hypothetical protein
LLGYIFESVMELLGRRAHGDRKLKGLDLLGVLPRLARRGRGGGGNDLYLDGIFGSGGRTHSNELTTVEGPLS